MFRKVLFERVWRAQALRFLRAEQGASTIEFVIWVPVFALLLGLVADAALIYGGQARILRVVQDGNRAMSIGRVTDTNTLESQIATQLRPLSARAVVSTTVAGGVINSSVTVPLSDLTATGLVAAFDGLTMTVSAQHMAEN